MKIKLGNKSFFYITNQNHSNFIKIALCFLANSFNSSKKNFNKLNKEYKVKYPNKKPLEYPKSKKLTKGLKVLFEEFNINPYN